MCNAYTYLKELDKGVEALPERAEHGLLNLLTQRRLEYLLRPAVRVDLNHGVLYLGQRVE
jgi:hypothetical protein